MDTLVRPETTTFEDIVAQLDVPLTCDALVVHGEFSVERLVPCVKVAEWRVTFTCSNRHTKKRHYCNDCMFHLGTGGHGCYSCLPAMNEAILLNSVPI